MSESIILKNILNVLKPYLNLNANELIFNQPCEINIDYGDHWEVVKDEKLDAKFLNSFLVELATRRNQRFDESHCHLSCELPSPFLRYRVQAQHKSSLFNSEIAICIRIPSKEIYPLESFILSEKCINNGWSYEKIKDLIHKKKECAFKRWNWKRKDKFFKLTNG